MLVNINRTHLSTQAPTVNGDTNYRASAWMQEDKKGVSHLSVSVQTKMEASGGLAKNDEMDDKIPF